MVGVWNPRRVFAAAELWDRFQRFGDRKSMYTAYSLCESLPFFFFSNTEESMDVFDFSDKSFTVGLGWSVRIDQRTSFLKAVQWFVSGY